MLFRSYLRMDADFHSAQFLNSTDAVFSYIRLMEKIPALRPPGQHALLIGLGSGSLARSLMSNPAVARLDAVEVDPEVVRVARAYFGPLDENGSFSLSIGDGRQFLRTCNRTFDLILLDAYASRQSVPSHLLTREFFGEVEQKLTSGGLVAINLISPPRAGLSPHARAALGSSFAHVWTYCTAPNESDQNLILLAWNDNASDASWRPPESIAGYGACLKEAGDAQPFTDDWAPTDLILAQTAR